MPEVTEINDIDQLDTLRAQWADLLLKTEDASFFHTPQWLQTYWKHFGDGKRLRLLVVGDIENPVGILPLLIRTQRRKVGTIRVLTYPLDNWGSFYGPISADPLATLHAALNHLRTTPQEWDLLELGNVRQGSDDPAETEHLMQLVDLPPYSRLRSATGTVNTSGRWSDYLADKTSKWRSNFHRAERRMEQLGAVRLERYRPWGEQQGEGDPRWDLYDTCESLAARSWQGSSATGTTLSHNSIRGFLREAHQVAARLGCLDMNLLYANETPVAFAYNYHFGNRVYGLRTGFDPDYAHYSPGHLVCVYAIRDSFSRRDPLYDLGAGSLHGKRHLVTRVEPIWQYTYYKPGTLRTRLLRWKAQLSDWWQTQQPARSREKKQSGEEKQSNEEQQRQIRSG